MVSGQPLRHAKIAVALFVVAVYVSEAYAVKMSNNDLIKMANNHMAPFSEVAMKRLHGQRFGSIGRATRTSDVVVINKTDKKFHLKSSNCQWGGYSSELLPEETIGPKSSTVYGMDSTSAKEGVSCTVVYQYIDNKGAPTGEYFKMVLDNTYNGYIGEQVMKNGTFETVSTLGQGYNNQVRLILQH